MPLQLKILLLVCISELSFQAIIRRGLALGDGPTPLSESAEPGGDDDAPASGGSCCSPPPPATVNGVPRRPTGEETKGDALEAALSVDSLLLWWLLLVLPLKGC